MPQGFEGEEVFGYSKQKEKLPLGLEEDSHSHDFVFFVHEWNIASNPINFGVNVHIHQSP